MNTNLSQRWAQVVICTVFFLLGTVPAFAQIRVISANPVSEALLELAEEFEHMTGNAVAVEVMGTTAINQLMASDEAADILVGTAASIDQAIADRQASSPKISVGRVGIGIIVREGAPVPDVSTVEAIRQAAIDAVGVIFNTAGSGRYVDSMLSGLGIGDEVTSKSARPRNAAETMDRMMSGQGMEIGFGLLSEIQPYEGNGIELIGRLPEELQNYIIYEGAVLARSTDSAAANAFLQFLTTGTAREIFNATGVD